MKELLDIASRLTGIVAPTAFLVSLVHEEGYYSAVGRKFQSIASLSDYLTSVLEWLPAVAGLVAAIWLFTLLTSPFYRPPTGLELDELRASSRRLSGSMVVIWFVIVLFFGGGGVAMYLYDDISDVGLAPVLIGIVAFAWIILVGVAFRGQNPADKLGKAGAGILFFGLPLIAGMYFWGLDQGYRDLSDTGQIYTLRRVDGATTQPIKVLRVYQRGVLVRSVADKTDTFIRWEQIRSLKLRRPTPSGSLGCIQIGFSC